MVVIKQFLVRADRKPVKPETNLIENTHRSGQPPKIEAHELYKLMLKQKLEEIILFTSFT